MRHAIFLLAALLFGLPAMADAHATRSGEPPIIIAHRGASGERPEHTLAAYDRAIEQGADYVEPDLVLTRDGVLVARHENEISGTTDVADHPEFAGRRMTKIIDGIEVTGWFTEDFTLAELRTLRARERLPQLRDANTAFDGLYPIPTFEEVIRLVRAREVEMGRTIGIYPETKHPSYFASIGLPHEAPLLELLARYGYDSADDALFIQSFEVGNLIALNGKTNVRLIQLVDASGHPADRPDMSYERMMTADGLTVVAAYADGIGPPKDMLIARNADGSLGASTGLVARAHAAGLDVHPWTFRRENYFLPANLRSGEDPRAAGDLAAEIRAFIAEGVDGLFTDNPLVGAAVVRPDAGGLH
ncbi:glycerophosphodiester phosphodiesterase [Sphingomonas lacunae]|uniref:glycerophosphodiester phosphodiesterase n=2 Tax=Sphingomonas lacunae TaxID=2698828 RepID=A0A6M4AX17_9SPHN|nr:glycerophosphodiester phosphodiesterase [Sphingomonas lacunae]